VVESNAAPLTTLCVSPLINPLIVSVKAGFATPYARLALLAVTVSVALLIVSVPFTKLNP